MTEQTKTTPLHDIKAPLNHEDMKQIEEECEEIKEWLYKKECTCIDIRGEDPECIPCQAIELIDILFCLIPKEKSV